jgi:hypothetical protein
MSSPPKPSSNGSRPLSPSFLLAAVVKPHAKVSNINRNLYRLVTVHEQPCLCTAQQLLVLRLGPEDNPSCTMIGLSPVR